MSINSRACSVNDCRCQKAISLPWTLFDNTESMFNWVYTLQNFMVRRILLMSRSCKTYQKLGEKIQNVPYNSEPVPEFTSKTLAAEHSCWLIKTQTLPAATASHQQQGLTSAAVVTDSRSEQKKNAQKLRKFKVCSSSWIHAQNDQSHYGTILNHAQNGQNMLSANKNPPKCGPVHLSS